MFKLYCQVVLGCFVFCCIEFCYSVLYILGNVAVHFNQLCCVCTLCFIDIELHWSTQLIILAVDAEATNTKQEMVYGKKGNVVCKADGAPKPTFIWSYNSSHLLPKNRPYDYGNGVLYFFNVTPEHAGKYRCILIQRDGRKQRQKEKVITVSVYGNLE